jgi:hypothetical protein
MCTCALRLTTLRPERRLDCNQSAPVRFAVACLAHPSLPETASRTAASIAASSPAETCSVQRLHAKASGHRSGDHKRRHSGQKGPGYQC